MREHWFGDHGDVIKWGLLMHLAHTHTLKTIVWVPYWRTEQSLPSFNYGAQRMRVQVSDNVWRFFRDIRRIELLAKREGVVVKIVNGEFDHMDRLSYSDNVRRHLTGYIRPLLLFLDPDTGLAPSTVAKEHVTDEDVRQAWSDLQYGEWLVLYQHRWRDVNWVNSSVERMSSICGGAEIAIARSEEIARDVALLCARKPN